ncbi:Pentatricopeptide repeat-containing protein [Nymphaea thermarum]|nr:Pentatricopeptide repeat-containing protein [Nymphaea thermarum]
MATATSGGPCLDPIVKPFPPHHLPFVLQRLECCRSIEELKQIHAALLKSRFAQSTLVLSKLVSLCAVSKHRNLDYARMVFNQIHFPTVHIYNSMIRGFSLSENPSEAILFYKKMVSQGLFPDNYTFPFVFRACGQLRALREGEELHVHAIKHGFESYPYVKNTLIRMYAMCGDLGAARQVFDRVGEQDLVSWTTMIAGYANMGFHKLAIEMFLQMERARVGGDEVTMVIVLSACSQLGDLDMGKKVHRYIVDNGIKMDVFVGNALVDMYIKCGDVDFACQVFDQMREKNVVSWNAMIAGLAQQGQFKEALAMFRKMQVIGFEPDTVTMVGVLRACASLGALDLGRWVHVYMDKNYIKADGYVGNALVDMYAKCGSIEQAEDVFNGMANRDVFSYTSMIVGFAMHGLGKRALALFKEMSKVGVAPDEITFIGVLSACSHAGLVEEGRRHFDEMIKVYCLTPEIEHYGCMVDLLGRAGLLDEAEEFIKAMPMQPDAFVWGALLGACKIHGKVELGGRISRLLLELEPQRDGAYVVMSNIYASASRWPDVVKIRKEMKARKLKKTPGCSLIELDGMVHEFRMGDRSHPKTKEIYLMLEEIIDRLKVEGYTACTSESLLDVDEEEKESSLHRHSEKLAIALGLISTSAGTSLRIVKNLRMCSDCHAVIKIISKIYSREIVVRDRNRFHHFRNGSCSCSDYW